MYTQTAARKLKSNSPAKHNRINSFFKDKYFGDGPFANISGG